jgi:hypothetical protein
MALVMLQLQLRQNLLFLARASLQEMPVGC